MNSNHVTVVLVFATVALLTQNVRAQVLPPVDASSSASSGLNGSPGKPTDLGNPPGKNKPATTPDKPGRDYSDQVKKLIDDAKAAQVKYLSELNDLQHQLKDATDDQKDKIRAEIRDKRDAFLEQQKEMREEFRKRVQELKDELKDHQDVINSAKEKAQDQTKPRKGGNN
jgi:molecular chaperone DnaK (HSP70)